MSGELRPDRLGDVLAAPDMTLLEPDAARAVYSLEGLGVDRREVGIGPHRQVLAVHAAEADPTREARLSRPDGLAALRSGSIVRPDNGDVGGGRLDENLEDVATDDVVDGIDVFFVVIGIQGGRDGRPFRGDDDDVGR